MTDIRSTTPGFSSASSAATGNASATDVDIAKQQDSSGTKVLPQHQPLPESVLKEIGGLSGTLDQILNMGKTGAAQTTGAKTGPGATGTTAPPSLPAPMMEFSAEDMALILTSLRNKTSEAQLANAKEGLNISKKKMEDLNANALDKIKTMIASAEKAAKADKDNAIMGWVSKIGGFVAAVLGTAFAAVMTVVTAGAAAPLLIIAAAGLVGATFSLASHISVSNGGPAFDLATLATKLVTKILEGLLDVIDKVGGLKGEVLKEVREKTKHMVEGVAQMVGGIVGCATLGVATDPSLFGNIFAGFAKVVGADEAQAAIVAGSFTAAASLVMAGAMIVLACCTGGAMAGAAISSAMKVVSAVGAIAQAGMTIAQGSLAIAQGAVTITKANEEHKGSIAMADKKMISAIMVKLQKEMEEGKDEIKKVIDEIMESINLVSQMINSGAQNRAQITSNMGGSRMNTI